MQLLLDNWWQFCFLILACAVALWIVGKATDSVFLYLKELLVVLRQELSSRTTARRAGGINAIMLFISGGLAFVVSIPSLAAQFGFLQDPNPSSPFIGPGMFLFVCIISTHYCRSVDKQFPAFKDNKKTLPKNVKT